MEETAVKKEEPIVFRLENNVRFYAVATGIFCFCLCYVFWLMKFTVPEFWLNFTSDIFKGLENYPSVRSLCIELFFWGLLLLFIALGYMRCLVGLTYKVEVFADKIVLHHSFKKESICWDEVVKCYHPWLARGGDYVIVGKGKKIWISVGRLKNKEALVAIIENSSAHH